MEFSFLTLDGQTIQGLHHTQTDTLVDISLAETPNTGSAPA